MEENNGHKKCVGVLVLLTGVMLSAVVLTGYIVLSIQGAQLVGEQLRQASQQIDAAVAGKKLAN